MARTAYITITMRGVSRWRKRSGGPAWNAGLVMVKVGVWLMGFRRYEISNGLGEFPEWLEKT